MSEPTLGELLAPTGLPELLERTPGQLLTDLGLDRLAPAAPGAGAPDAAGVGALLAPPALPDLPVLPALDPLALLTPLTDLLATFGTGTLPGGAGDPTVLLTGISQALQSGIGAATSAVESLSGLWTGDGATGAVAKTALATADAGGLAAQSAAMTTDIQGGLAIVGAGLAAVQGVIVKTAGLIAAALPAIATPPGQLAVLGFAADGLAETMAVVAATRAQLAAPTAKMAIDGAPVPVTPPPLSPDTVTGLAQAVLPLMSSGLQLAGTLLGSAVPATTPQPAAAGSGGAAALTAPAAAGITGGTGAAAAAGGTGPAGSGSAGSGSAGSGSGATGPAGAGAGGGSPTVRPAGVGPVAAAEPVLGSRPVSAEPMGGASPSSQQSAPGWNRPAAAVGPGAPFAPLAPAMAGTGVPRNAVVARGPAFDTGAAVPVDGGPASVAAASGVLVLGQTRPPPITVDVDFRIGDPESPA